MTTSTQLAQVIKDLQTTSTLIGEISNSVAQIVSGAPIVSGGPSLNYGSVYPSGTNSDGTPAPLQVLLSGISDGLTIPALITSLQNPPPSSDTTGWANTLQTASNSLASLANTIGAMGAAANQIIANTNYKLWAGILSPPTAKNGFEVPGPNQTGPLDIVIALDSFDQSGALFTTDSGILGAMAFQLGSGTPLGGGVFHQLPQPPAPTFPPIKGGGTTPAPTVPPLGATNTPAPAPATSNTALYVGGAVLGIGIIGAIAYAMKGGAAAAVRENPIETYVVVKNEGGRYYGQSTETSRAKAERQAELASKRWGGEYHVLHNGRSIAVFRR